MRASSEWSRRRSRSDGLAVLVEDEEADEAGEESENKDEATVEGVEKAAIKWRRTRAAKRCTCAAMGADGRGADDEE